MPTQITQIIETLIILIIIKQEGKQTVTIVRALFDLNFIDL